jgi:hypothetical protein
MSRIAIVILIYHRHKPRDLTYLDLAINTRNDHKIACRFLCKESCICTLYLNQYSNMSVNSGKIHY